MKKLKITEEQAKLLGIKYITENEPESGLKSVGTSIGEVIIRAVISGDNVPRLKDRIIQIVKRHDKDANINFFEATNKIVGQIKEIKLSAIKRDLKDLDPTIIIENKPLTKNLVKINKEQYDRLVKSGLIKENSINKIDDTFKKEFAGKNIQNLKPVSEDNFSITKPNTSVPKLSKNIGDNELPVHENDADDNLKKETLELLKYLYRKSENFSSFWEGNGLTYDEICKALLSKNLIIGKYEVSKTSDNPETAKQAIEDELRTMIKPENEEMVSEPELETEASDLPAGAEHDSNAPWNKKDDYSSPIKAKESKLDGLTVIEEENVYIAILEGPDGSKYTFNYYGVDKPNLAKYASVERSWVGKDDEGKDEYEYSDDFEITPEVIANYVNDNLSSLDKGEGIDDYKDGVSLVKIDEPLKQKLLALYDKNIKINEFFGSVSEDEEKSSHDIAKEKISSSLPITSSKPKTDPEILRKKIADIRNKELENRKKTDLEEIDFTKQGPKFNEGDYVKYIQGDLDIETWYGIITRIVDLDGEYAYRINSYHKDKNTGKIWDDSPKTNEKYEAVLKPSSGQAYNELKSQYSKELAETTSASSGAFTAPLGGGEIVKREMPNTPVVGETTVAGAGNFQYDTPGLANVGRNGEFKKGPKTKAQSKTQYAGGSFVETSSCTKLNNNKEAQNGKCSQGAVDGVVKQKKTNGSIISPSLGENHIYEEISKKTGLTIDKIKNIINSKKILKSNNFT